MTGRILMMPQVQGPWWTARRGIPSCSNFDKIMTAAKCVYSAQADDYIDELCGDLINLSPNYFTEKGVPLNSFAIARGAAMEPEARRWAAMNLDMDITEVGLIVDGHSWCGSPDGIFLDKAQPGRIVESDWQPTVPDGTKFNELVDAVVLGGLELKCPLPKTQVAYLREREKCGGKLKNGSPWMPAEYFQQVHGHLACWNLPWWKFLSYGPPEPIEVTIYPDEFTVKLKAALDRFQTEFAQAKRLLGLGQKEEAAV